jgi:hypothetical protein
MVVAALFPAGWFVFPANHDLGPCGRRFQRGQRPGRCSAVKQLTFITKGEQKYGNES